MKTRRLRNLLPWRRFLCLLFFTLLSFAVMGYHPGYEDDGTYLTAVKARLNPAFYPHNADFFRLEMQATVFDRAMAGFVRITGIPLAWAELLCQMFFLFAILWACHSIARRLFRSAGAQWAAVAMVAAMFTLPVAGTALLLVDQHFHPRTVASALILAAISCCLHGNGKRASLLLALSAFVHPIMAAFGASFCLLLTLALNERLYAWVSGIRAAKTNVEPGPAVVSRLGSGRRGMTLAAPLSWLFAPASPSWRAAMNMHSYYFIYKWQWYEWLGAIAPLALFYLLWRWARSRGENLLARFALATFSFGVFQQLAAFLLLTPASWIRLAPLQPMRYLHLVYFALALVAGGLMGEFVLKKSLWRWAAYLVIFNAAMLLPQEVEFPATRHLELPGLASSNDWLEAFAWIRQNTLLDAYFVCDPAYVDLPGEDSYSFRALAERSSLADAIKDSAVAAQIPSLGPIWAEQVAAEQGWGRFGAADFQRLKQRFGVDWAIVDYPAPAGLDCRWHNRTLAVCRIP
jgi:hypothetical protein